MATVLNIDDLIAGDNPAEYRALPVIIGSNQCSGSVVKFQSRISQRIRDPKLRELYHLVARMMTLFAPLP